MVGTYKRGDGNCAGHAYVKYKDPKTGHWYDWYSNPTTAYIKTEDVKASKHKGCADCTVYTLTR
ncbi:hypothetical protein [Streptomyces flaveus]|uniref:hypothetical protein n=1 Tax=Streptomyces flaveus TaxID=66370 RepID=UPI00331F0E33